MYSIVIDSACNYFIYYCPCNVWLSHFQNKIFNRAIFASKEYAILITLNKPIQDCQRLQDILTLCVVCLDYAMSDITMPPFIG